MDLYISSSVRQKLTEKHGVGEDDIVQSFANREGEFLKDLREEHRTDPPTLWFVAETDSGRRLKVVFIMEPSGRICIKTAYDANPMECQIYEKHAK